MKALLSDFREQVRKIRCIQSMSLKDGCYANAHAESLWATSKKEVLPRIPEDIDDAERQLFDYTETFCNLKRAHSLLSFLSSIQFEKRAFPAHHKTFTTSIQFYEILPVFRVLCYEFSLLVLTMNQNVFKRSAELIEQGLSPEYKAMPCELGIGIL